MSGNRVPFGATTLAAVIASLTTWVALTTWSVFIAEPGDYQRRLIVLGGVIVVTGVASRTLGTPRWATALLQVVALAAALCWQVSGSLAPVGAAGTDLVAALHDALDSARTYAAPVADQAPPVWPLLVLGGAMIMLIVDLLACTWRRVPLAGLALLAAYSLPSGVLDQAPPRAAFAVSAAGFLLLLHLGVRDTLGFWGRIVGPTRSRPWGPDNPLREAARTGAGRIGITATAIALVVPPLIPVLDTDLFAFGQGTGSGDIRIRKPITDMRRDLERGTDIPLIRITTRDRDPSYLRVSVLNRFTGSQWSSGDRSVDPDDTADGPLPPPVGLSDQMPTRAYEYNIDITDEFDSTWLPTFAPASQVRADGDWRFDPSTLDFLAADDDLDTRGLSYTTTGLKPNYGTDGTWFRDTPTGAVSEELLDLPGDLPQLVTDLARSVTEPAATDYERALLLQRWFRRDGGFTYDLARAPDGAGNGTLAAFLAPGGRVGYCEQYASAMAVMARVLDIPARVAVGFLEPEQTGAGRWEYSSHDLHAWPELYFADAGWVRFEPTPAGRVSSVPAYTRVPVDAVGEEVDLDPSAGASDPAGDPSVAPAPRPSAPNATDDPGVDVDARGEGGDGRLQTLLGAVVLISLLVLLVLLGPRSVRGSTRRSRLAGGPDDLWTEIRATSLDLGLGWPDGRSPREAATFLRPLVDGADGALDRIVGEVERARYARPGTVDVREATTLAADTATVLEALTERATPAARRRAIWAPRTVWPRAVRTSRRE